MPSPSQYYAELKTNPSYPDVKVTLQILTTPDGIFNDNYISPDLFTSSELHVRPKSEIIRLFQIHSMWQQSFIVIAPKLRSILGQENSFSLGHMLFLDRGIDTPPPLQKVLLKTHFGDIAHLVTNLIVPVRPTNPARNEGKKNPLTHLYRQQIASRNARHGLHFINLPQELQDLVFEYLDFHDCIHLGRAHSSFWEGLQDTIMAQHMAILGQWAGQSIICVGAEGRRGDYPVTSLFSLEEENEVSQYVGTDTRGRVTPLNLYNFAQAKYVEPESFVKKGATWQAAPPFFMRRIESCEHYLFERYPWEDKHSTLYQHGKFNQPRLERFCPVDKAWILRNLTTKQFVRSEGIALRPEFIDGPHIKIIGFGHVVLSRICWSSDSNTGLDYKGNIHRGIWTGHSFDITTVDRHEETTKNEQDWEDINEEIAEEIAEIWGSKYGFDWSRKVIKRLLPYSW